MALLERFDTCSHRRLHHPITDAPSRQLVSCSFVNVIDFMPELLTKVVVPLSSTERGLSGGDSLA